MLTFSIISRFRQSRLAPVALAAAGMLAMAPEFAGAQTSLAELAKYQGADRMERLVAGAKAEGALTLYTVAPVPDYSAITEAFTAKYGIPVTVWRAGAPDVLRRVLAEVQAGRYDVDVVENLGTEIEALHRENILQPVTSPLQSEIFAGALPQHREWAGNRLQIISAAYNTDLIPAASLPKTWTDLLKPEWKGKLAIEAEGHDWLEAMAGSFPSRQEGIDFFRKLRETNGTPVQTGYTLLTNMVVSGEVPFAMTVYEYRCRQLHDDGAPIKCLPLQPSIARVFGIGVTRTTKHPNAALLFYDFALNEAQDILAKKGYTPANVKKYPLPGDMKVQVVDSVNTLDHLADLRQQFQDVFRGQ